MCLTSLPVVQALYPGPLGYPVWQQMCSVAAAPKAQNVGMYNSGGSGSGSGGGSGSGMPPRSSGSGYHHGCGGDAVVPCAVPLQGGQDDSIWAEEAEAVTHPAMMQVRPILLSFFPALFVAALRVTMCS